MYLGNGISVGKEQVKTVLKNISLRELFGNLRFHIGEKFGFAEIDSPEISSESAQSELRNTPDMNSVNVVKMHSFIRGIE